MQRRPVISLSPWETGSLLSSMKKFRLRETFDTVGAFWPYGQTEAEFTGTLSSRNGDVSLGSSPTYTVIDPSKAFRDAFDAMSRLPDFQRTASICGFTPHGPCTLVNAVRNAGKGLTDTRTGQQLASSKYEHGRLLMGLHIESAFASCVDGAGFFLTKMHHLLPTPWTMEFNTGESTFRSPLEALPVFHFSSVDLKAEVICEVFSGGGVKAKKGARIKSVPRVRVIPQAPQSLAWFISLGFRLENFFALFLGTSVTLKRMQAFVGDDVGWLVQNVRRSKRERVNRQTWVCCRNSDMAEALANWLATPESEQPVEKIVLDTLRKSKMPLETEFLSLAQALECFGRLHFSECLIDKKNFKRGLASVRKAITSEWGQNPVAKRCLESLGFANEASYSSRTLLVCGLLSIPFLEKLIGEQTDFVRVVVQTRNYFTHLGIDKKQSVADESKTLFLLNQKLHALLRCVMLLKLGISEELLVEPVLYQASKWS